MYTVVGKDRSFNLHTQVLMEKLFLFPLLNEDYQVLLRIHGKRYFVIFILEIAPSARVQGSSSL